MDCLGYHLPWTSQNQEYKCLEFRVYLRIDLPSVVMSNQWREPWTVAMDVHYRNDAHPASHVAHGSEPEPHFLDRVQVSVGDHGVAG